MTQAPPAGSAADEATTDPEPAVEAPASDRPRGQRRRWSLQTRLMATVIGIVSLILVIVAIATSAALGRVLEANLDAQLQNAAEQAGRALQFPQFPGTRDAYDVLNEGRQEPGFLFVVQPIDGELSGAYVAEDLEVVRMTDEQLQRVVDSIGQGGFSTVSLGDGIGDYRVIPVRGDSFIALAGLPVSEVRSTIGETLTTIALVTAGGLLLLAAAIAFVIRAGLKPLRAVADTATRVAALPLSEGAVSITERVPDDETDEHTEIGRVGHALNTLLDHVGESLDARQRNEERMRRFVADASHELRTPLASIRGFSELSLRALRQAPATAPRAETVETTEASLERIQAQSIRMTGLVEDLLLLARLDEGQELVYGSVDLSRLAIEAVADATPAGPDHAWELDLDEEPVVVTGDSARLHQVVGNLLANARTHTPAGTNVTVSVAREGTDAVLRVHDDGPGVDPAIADELFERFSRADRSRARKTGGTGLGLSIAQAIVTAHGGSLAVRSVPGDTTFVVRLPLAPGPDRDQ